MKTINDYMTIKEAAYRWNIKTRTLLEKLNIKRRPALQKDLDNGIVKHFKSPDAKNGDWIISTDAMKIWYGNEPQNIGGIWMKQPVVLDGQTLDLEVLAEYMDDELRESVNDEKFASDQEYIELYLDRAKEEDPEFIEVLESEFGVTV